MESDIQLINIMRRCQWLRRHINMIFKKFAFEELPIFESPGKEGAVISRKSQG